MERLAAYIGLDQHSFAGVMDWVLQLRELLDIPPTLAGLGLDDTRAIAAILDVPVDQVGDRLAALDLLFVPA